jgi:hypothetical protein
MDKNRGQGAWTRSVDKEHGQEAWSNNSGATGNNSTNNSNVGATKAALWTMENCIESLL